jgi:hypothetical protein
VLRLDFEKIGHAFESEDWEILNSEAGLDVPSQTIYVDLPVHKSLVDARTMSKERPSPYIWVMSHLNDPEGYHLKSTQILHIRTQLFPIIRKLPQPFFNKNGGPLEAGLKQVFPEDADRQIHQGNLGFAFYRAFDMLYLPILDVPKTSLVRSEFKSTVERIGLENSKKLKELLNEIKQKMDFEGLSRKTIDTICKCFSKSDAFLPALIMENLKDPKPSVEEFSIFRDDFDELKSVFVEIFELQSKYLLIIGAVANLANRGTVESWGDGQTRSFKKAMKLKAFDREFILNEYPEAKSLLSMSNRLRNDFAHYNVRYDFPSGQLVNEKEERVHVLSFLGDVLNAVRSSHY